jgi:hypothetical protein
MTTNDLIILSVSVAIIHTFEACHDFAVIKSQAVPNTSEEMTALKKWNDDWHTFSALVFFAFYALLAYLQSSILILPLAATIRGMFFWPILNKLLKRKLFHLSDHLLEKEIHSGEWLFASYLFFYSLTFYCIIS